MSRTYDGSPILSGDQIRVSTQPRVIAERPHSQHSKPKVTFKREGDVIKEIHVLCGCGEEIVLECDYPASGVAVPPRPAVKPVLAR